MADLNVSIEEDWEGFVEAALRSGLYSTASEVGEELRLVKEGEEARLQALRDTLSASLEKGGAHGRDDVTAFLAAEAAKLARDASAPLTD